MNWNDFLKSKFDNLALFIVLALLGFLMLHILHHNGVDTPALSWVEQTFTTVLGAYIGLTQASRMNWTKTTTGGNGNGTDKTSTTTASTDSAPTNPNPVVVTTPVPAVVVRDGNVQSTPGGG